MPRIFYVIKIKDKNLSTIIDGIRILADPFEKQEAHITVRGPYPREVSDFSEINDEIKDTKVIIDGLSTFFEFEQNTIFLKCNSPYLEKAWYKPNFAFNPHLTLYDGIDRDFAQRLLSILNKYSFQFSLNVEGIEPIKSVKKQANAFNAINYDFKHLSYYLEEEISYSDIQQMSQQERLLKIEKLSKYFLNWSKNKSYPSPIQKVIDKLQLTENNGLFYFSNLESWENKFPYRITRAIKVMKPYAFFSLLKNVESNYKDQEQHPMPFNQPLMLFFDEPGENEENIHTQVFSFGQAPVVFIDKRNGLEIYNGLFFQNKNKSILKKIGDEKDIMQFSFKRLYTGAAWESLLDVKNSKRVDEFLLENLSEARNILIENLNLSPSLANSILGRLLFVRYLLDREVEFQREDGESDYFPGNDRQSRKDRFLDTIQQQQKLYDFFDYLGRKLNGDLFPITIEEKQKVGKEHLEVLYHLFRGAKLYSHPVKGYQIQNSLFDLYDFKIIPIELISNIYEQFIGKRKRVENKAFYTPSFLVDYILSQTVSPHLASSEFASCKVLDPSCGSGIFLIETLRKIIEKEIQVGNESTIKNKKLWKLVKENIFGIDIDPDAIEVAIFSLYVTVLDYVEPKVIAKDFKFEKLKNVIFFPEADFFDTAHPFNEKLKDIKFDFILGNPPWGQVESSSYIDYCGKRELKEREKSKDKAIEIGISDKQIAQAFLVRTSDFVKKETKCGLVVTSKVLYNLNAKTWRNYFLSNFKVDEVFELSAVNTKIFNGAAWPAAIIFYSYVGSKNNTAENIVHHISLKPNRFFQIFKTIVIEKYDYKKIQQKYFMESKGGHDWLWKVLLYGNILDFYFIKRIKSDFTTIQEIIEDKSLEYGVGLKRKDANKKKDATSFIGKPFLDTDKKEFRRFSIRPSVKWNSLYAAAIPNKINSNNYPILFKGPLVLVKEGLDTGFKCVSAFCSSDIVFTHSVRAIKGKKTDSSLLKSFVALFNSNLFAYYIFSTGTSTGIDFIRANQIEQFSFPAVIDERLAVIVDSIQGEVILQQNNILSSPNIKIAKLESNLDEIINELYAISEIEKDLLSYSREISIPLTKSTQVDRTYKAIADRDNNILEDYANIFIDHFSKSLESTGKFFKAEILKDQDLIAMNFVFLNDKPRNPIEFVESKDVLDNLNILYNLSFENLSTQLYIQRDVKGFEKNSFYVIKPNEFKAWHKAIARLDIAEFIEAIMKSGAKLKSLKIS